RAARRVAQTVLHEVTQHLEHRRAIGSNLDCKGIYSSHQRHLALRRLPTRTFEARLHQLTRFDQPQLERASRRRGAYLDQRRQRVFQARTLAPRGLEKVLLLLVQWPDLL